ncbi:MAG: DUF4908 domain-containing protein [Oceanicaulis sp.]
MFRGLITLCVLAAGVWALLGTDGVSQPNPFQQMLGRDSQEEARQSAWFERADGRGRFIFDRTNQPALVWNEGSMEVYAAYRGRATGGGEIWRTDTDRVILRTSNLGGWTYFPPDRPEGVLVDPVGRARTLVAAPAGPDQLQDAARDMVDTLARLSRNEVSAELTALTPDQNPYIIDAMAMIAYGAEGAPRRALRDLQVVRVGVGEAPRASFDGQVLDVSVAPHMGYGGRPSSEAIRLTLERGAR